jgi:hypothetical protein
MMPLRCAKDDMQSLGSAITYARRYTLQSMVCLATGEDDDGNSAVGEEKMEAKVGRRRNTRIATPAKPQEELVTDDFLK